MNRINPYQMTLLKEICIFPSTRYQGSKLKIVDWIWENIKDLEFNTALDAFGGTGCVAYLLKRVVVHERFRNFAVRTFQVAPGASDQSQVGRLSFSHV